MDTELDRVAYLKNELRKYHEILINNTTRIRRYHELGLISDKERDHRISYWGEWVNGQTEDMVEELRFLMM